MSNIRPLKLGALKIIFELKLARKLIANGLSETSLKVTGSAQAIAIDSFR